MLVIDIKGDLPNLKLAFPSFDPPLMAPWVEAAEDDEDGIADLPLVLEEVTARKEGLAAWSIGEAELADYAARTCVRVLTPGSDAGVELLVSLAGKKCTTCSRRRSVARRAGKRMLKVRVQR